MNSETQTPQRPVKGSMTLASKITVLRIISIPFFAIALLERHLLWAQIIFSLSVFSDALDGTIARLRGERTPLGAFLDPLADKLLLVVTYIVFSNLGWIPLWVFVAVISRDLLIILGWTVVYILTHNSKIEPRPLGKVTTALQMTVAIGRLFNVADPYYSVALYLMIAATLLSAADYVWIGNKRLGGIGMTLPPAGLFVASYLLGSIPTGYWLGRAWKGIDIRQHGSGNLGATNVYRVLGAKPAIFTFTIDCLKGLIPVLLAKRLFPDDLSTAIGAGVAAILGHTTSIFVRFRGGKGMATSTGVFAALMPLPALAAIAVFLTVTGLTRYVSLGSIVGSLTLVASSFMFSAPYPLVWTSALVAVFVVWKHRQNIQRLLRGTENRITFT